jgi:5-hydroxyisourate hydrolase
VISTHVLDAAVGRPAVGVAVRLESAEGTELGAGITDTDGRIAELAPGDLGPGSYRLVFDTGGYFFSRGQESFYPQVIISFGPVQPDQHSHVPLLLSPYAYSTYRGS